MNWLVFSYSLPGKSGSGPRVNLWRRLRRLGAISPAGGAQVLPAREECLESLSAAIELVLDYRREQGLEKAPRGAEQTSVLV